MNSTGKELIRISRENPDKFEYSTDDGKSWHTHCIKCVSRYSDTVTGKNMKISPQWYCCKYWNRRN
jgi:hypothetical protein